MHKLELETRSRHQCRIHVGKGLLAGSGLLVRQAGNLKRMVIITDSNVGPLYAGTLTREMEIAGLQVDVITFPAGEENKTLRTATSIYRQLAGLYADRSTAVAALGGGVAGDLAGFAAATYLRGLPLIQVPTSLLAQVDSSIGGKTGVNLDRLKNQIGVFHQPVLTITDSSTLDSLPEREYINGLAEVIKSAAIADAGLFTLLENNTAAVLGRKPELVDEIIFRAARVKVKIVSADETDTGDRQLLNFGHTIGHAIETCSGFNITHGQAIAIGMAKAADISHLLGLLASHDVIRLKSLIKTVGLPIKLPKIEPAQLIEAMRHDKKISAGSLQFVLLGKPGESLVSRDIDFNTVEKVLAADNE
ncbi:MAG: 3-dehydroquinate synthase [Dehalococcoidaceae bacterium]|nr:3-dehydroquinate synthase [Dehalococcoidaceae bacterium]